MKFLKGCIVLAAFALVLMVSTNCRPAPARASEGMGLLRVGFTFANAPGDSVGVPVSWTPGSVQDGYGPIDGYATNGIRLTPTPIRDTLAAGWTTLASTARSDTVWIPMPARLTNGQTATGKVCVSQRRQGQRGQAKCPTWTFTMTVPPPGPVDSAWSGSSYTNIVMGWIPRARYFLGESLILGHGYPQKAALNGTFTEVSGHCIAARASSGRLIARPSSGPEVIPGVDQEFRRICDDFKSQFWSGQTVVLYSQATAAERSEVAKFVCVKHLVECGNIDLCRMPTTVGCDQIGWRVLATVPSNHLLIIGAAAVS